MESGGKQRSGAGWDLSSNPTKSGPEMKTRYFYQLEDSNQASGSGKWIP